MASLGRTRAKSYAILLSIVFSASMITFGLGVRYADRDARGILCDVVNAQLEIPAPKPFDPKLHPGAMEMYLVHQKLLLLKATYRCRNGVSGER